MTRIKCKWRPPLWLVVAVTLLVVLCLPVIGIVFVRYAAPVMGYREAVYGAGGGVLAATFVMGWGLWRFLLGRVRALRDRLGVLRSGGEDAFAPLDQYGTSDMHALGQSFLDMGNALHRREVVLRSFADHVTHELKSPITVVRGAAELLGSPDLPAAERDILLGRIAGAADRMTFLLDAQRALALAEDPGVGGEALLSDVATDVDVAQDGVVPLPQDALRLVLDHLVGNARAHGATKITVSFDGTLTVQDNVPGVSEGHRTKIFEPFFTSRRAGEGTGMGLPIVRRILEAHDAEIALVPSDVGARFVLTF